MRAFRRGKAPSPAQALDMTQGSPLRLLMRFALPLFIGNIFQQLYGVADTMVVGYNLGDQAIAAIGATGALYGLLFNLAIGLNNGYAIIVTRAFGARDEKQTRQAIAGMAALNIAVSLGLSLLSLAGLRPLMRLLNTPPEVFEQAYIYIAILCGGVLATVSYNMLSAILRAMGDSRTPLRFLVISCVLNIILDILLVAVLHTGVAGAAIATVASQAASALLCGAYVLRHYRHILPRRADFRVPARLLRALCSAGFTMAFVLCVVDIGSVVFQRACNSLGALYVSAYAAARRIMMVLIQPLSTLSMAAATFVGQNWGAGRMARIKAGFRLVLAMEALWGVFACALAFLLGEEMIRLTTGTTDPDMLRHATLSLRAHLACFPALGVLFSLRTTLQSMERKLAPFLSSCVELAVKVFAAWWLIPRAGFPGVCVTEPAAWVLMAVVLALSMLIQRRRLLQPAAI